MLHADDVAVAKQVRRCRASPVPVTDHHNHAAPARAARRPPPSRRCQAAIDLNCEVVQAAGEADVTIATLVRRGRAFAAVSDDGDLLARGCERLLRVGGKNTAPTITYLSDVLAEARVDENTVRCARARRF